MQAIMPAAHLHGMTGGEGIDGDPSPPPPPSPKRVHMSELSTLAARHTSLGTP